MAGNRIGGKRAAQTMKDLYGPDYFRKLGASGGKKSAGPEYGKYGSKPTGFAADIERARQAGSLGGKRSHRGPNRKKENAHQDETEQVNETHKSSLGFWRHHG